VSARLNGTSWLEARHPSCGSCSRLAGGLRRFLNASRLLALASLLIAGCASVPRDIPRPPSVAFQGHESTALGQRIAKDAAGRPGQSGFSLMRYGHEAFTARIALADLAQKSIDVQYYIWEADATGRILAERLTRAAERGVRVRVLIDDANLQDLDAAVARVERPSTMPREISSRSINVNVDLDRCRSGGRIPPDLARMRCTDE